MTAQYVIVASHEAYYIWQYSVPRQYTTGSSLNVLMAKGKAAAAASSTANKEM